MNKMSQQELSAYIILSFIVLLIFIISMYMCYKCYVCIFNRGPSLLN